MAIPVLGAVTTYAGEKLVWRLMRWAAVLGAKAFKDKYNPRVHGLKSRKWMWNHVWLPIINKARKSPEIWDDPAGEYIYYQQACYIEDGTLAELLRKARVCMSKGNETDIASQHISDALRYIELSADDKVIK